MAVSSISFQIKLQTNFPEKVVLVGSTEILGNWNPLNGIELKTSSLDYPLWSTPHPLKFKRGI
jgi:hypothetical protein